MSARTVKFMIKHARVVFEQDPAAYHQLIMSLRAMCAGGDGGQPSPWALCTVRSDYYSDWPDEDFGLVLDALGESREGMASEGKKSASFPWGRP